MSVKITVLYDNRCDNRHLQEGWGFSALIEFEGAKILFDTGGDPVAFFSNADQIRLPYSEITHLLFSHKHWDHIAGFKKIVSRMNREAILYVPKTFPRLLIKNASSHLRQTKVVKSFETIAPNIYSLVLRGGFWLYEQTLVLKTSNGLGIITGCAHPGITKILQEAQRQLKDDIAFVVGGFHYVFSPGEACAPLVQEFQKLHVQKVAPCHCSGDHLIRRFQEAYGPNCLKVGTGTILSF